MCTFSFGTVTLFCSLIIKAAKHGLERIFIIRGRIFSKQTLSGTVGVTLCRRNCESIPTRLKPVLEHFQNSN